MRNDRFRYGGILKERAGILSVMIKIMAQASEILEILARGDWTCGRLRGAFSLLFSPTAFYYVLKVPRVININFLETTSLPAHSSGKRL